MPVWYTLDMQAWVYNAFSQLNFRIKPDFNGYRYATGAPTFLIRLLKKEWKYDVESYQMGRLALSNFDTKNPNMGALLFQTGYLTIKTFLQTERSMTWDFPTWR